MEVVERHGLAQTYIPVHTPYIFLLAFYGLIFYRFRALFSLVLRKKNVCCLTKSHGLETWGLLRRYNGLVIPCLSSPSISSLFLPSHPPYNLLHLASRFIVYFMVIIPSAPDHTIFRGLFLTLQGFSSLLTLHCILPLPLRGARYKHLLSVLTSQSPSSSDHFHVHSHIPFFSFSRVHFSHFPHRNGMHIIHRFSFL